MTIHFRSKPFGRLINNRKGYAGIIATIFLVLIILFLFFNVYTFYNNRNTAYQDTVSQVAQMTADRDTELASLSIVNPAASAAGNIVYISCSIQDNGPLPAQLVRLWVKDLTNSVVGNSASSIILQPGSATKYFNSVSIANVSSSDQFAFWFLTARGNAISASPSTNQVIDKGSSSGILDGVVSAYGNTSSLLFSLTTTKANDLLYVTAVYDSWDNASTLHSTPSLNWFQRALSNATDNAGGDSTLQTWYAIMPWAGTISITSSLSSKNLNSPDYDWGAVAMAISGVNMSSPFDGNSQIALNTKRGTGQTANVFATTTHANDFVIGAVEVDEQNPPITPGTGFTQVLPVQGVLGDVPKEPGRSVWAEYYHQTMTQPNLSINCTFDGNYAWAVVADAVRLGDSAITLSTLSGSTGQAIAVSGSGFAVNSPLSATFNGSPITLSGFTGTDAQGNIPPSTTFAVPPGTTPGNKTVTIKDGNSNSASIIFTVTTPTITASPASGPIGTSVIVTGSNFIPYSNIRINFDGSPIATDPIQIIANATGGFIATFNVPYDTAGIKTVLASDWVNFASTNFAVSPSIIITPIEGENNTLVAVSGQGFAAESNIIMQFDGATISTLPQNVMTDWAGSFSGVTFIAQSSAGSMIVNATDASGNSGFATFNLITNTVNDTASAPTLPTFP